MPEEIRFDAGRLGKAVRTPQGGVKVPAAVTRVGILPYRTPDGKTRLEFRPPEEVFREDSLATLRMAPLTIGHVAMVTPENYSELAKGNVGESVRKDGDFVATDAYVNVGDALARIDAGELSEVSAGYQVDYDPTPGVWNGQRYDGVQRNIRYNHVALLPSGGGRAGRDVGLRLDSASAVCDEFSIPNPEKTMKIRIDGVEYEAGSQECHAALVALEAKAQGAEKLQGRCDQLDADLKKATDALAVANDPARLDALVTEAVELRTKATAVLGAEYSFTKSEKRADGADAVVSKTRREIMIDVVRADSADYTGEGHSDDRVLGRFEMVCAKGVRADSVLALPGALNAAKKSASRTDAAEVPDAAKAQADMNARIHSAHKSNEGAYKVA